MRAPNHTPTPHLRCAQVRNSFRVILPPSEPPRAEADNDSDEMPRLAFDTDTAHRKANYLWVKIELNANPLHPQPPA